MIIIKGFSRQDEAHGTQIDLQVDEFLGMQNVQVPFLLVDRVLETYMEPYELPAEDCLSTMLIDAFYDDVTAPAGSDKDAKVQFVKIAKLAGKRIKWECDKDALLDSVVVGPDPRKEEAKEKAKGWQRLKEEREADEFITVMPPGKRSQPRKTGRASTSQTVESGITFVP